MMRCLVCGGKLRFKRGAGVIRGQKAHGNPVCENRKCPEYHANDRRLSRA